MSHIELERSRSVATIRLNRPEKRNPLSAGMVAALSDALTMLASESEIRTIVLTGNGSVFSAGADLAELDAMGTASMGDHALSSAALADLFRSMRLHPKPIIAKINGHAIAGGVGLALASDFAIASDRARIGFTEVRIGFVPAIVSALARFGVSDRTMRDLLLTGRLIDASEAVRVGLLTQVTAPELLDETVDKLTTLLSTETSATAVAMTKRLLAASEGMPQSSAFKFLSAHNALARATQDCRDGVSAFLQKSDPPWKRGDTE